MQNFRKFSDLCKRTCITRYGIAYVLKAMKLFRFYCYIYPICYNNRVESTAPPRLYETLQPLFLQQ